MNVQWLEGSGVIYASLEFEYQRKWERNSAAQCYLVCKFGIMEILTQSQV